MFYAEALARIQARDYGAVAEQAAPGIMGHLHSQGIHHGCVIDLGCGAGPLARLLGDAGFEVLGFDVSRPLVRLAHARAPRATIRTANIQRLSLPRAHAITAVGEVLQYCPPNRDAYPLPRFLAKARQALLPGGMLFFDLITEPIEPAHQNYEADGPDWHIEIEAHQDGPMLRRGLHITTQGHTTHEKHCQHIWPEGDVLKWLRQAGFRAVTSHSYGVAPIMPRRRVFIAQKFG